MKKLLVLTFVSAFYTISILAQTNRPPQITCPAESITECGDTSSTSVSVSDADGDSLTVVWSINDVAIQTNTVAGTDALAGTSVSFSAVLPLGTNVVEVTATDSAGNAASCSTTADVLDTTPPTIDSVTASPGVLWPPNHKLVPVAIHASVTDSCGPVTWNIVSVTSNEAENAKGSGHTGPDWKITGDHTVSLRAERSGKSSGRVYTITVQAVDVGGNVTQAKVTVTVPHDQRKKPPVSKPAPSKPAPSKGKGHPKP
jgi:hypothetical protein